MPAARSWAVWTLPPLAVIYVLAVDLLAVGAFAMAAATVGFGTVRDLWIFGLLTGCGLVCVEVMRRVGEAAGHFQDLMDIWRLPIALLLPAPYALLAPIPDRWRAHRAAAPSPPYRRIFTVAAVGLAHLVVNRCFHAVAGAHPLTDWGHRAGLLLAAAVVAGLLGAAANYALVATAVRLSSPTRWRDRLPDRNTQELISVEVSAGITVAALVADAPVLVIVALPPTIMLQRSLLHAQLRAAARTDPKTGLLNASTWSVEADRALTRAIRQHGPLSVLMIDLDRFKAVNDTYGHLAGDRLLTDVAGILGAELREIDVLGRFGGDEFVAALASEAQQARVTAERLRARIAEHISDVDGLPVSVTVSIGVVTIHPTRADDLTGLLAAADAALYGAKHGGRNQTHQL